MNISPTPEEVITLTPFWVGERGSDGRPIVPDSTLEMLRSATTEQAWTAIHSEGYPHQFAGGWKETQPGKVTVGRAVTAQFLPHRPDLDQVVVEAGARAEHDVPDRQNTWIIESLVRNDIMVVDIFGKVAEGTVVGDNLGTAVAARTGVGAIIDGGLRDLDGLRQLSDANFYYREADPSPIRNVTLAGINIPIRIGGATVLPGDVVLGTPTGVVFIPSHLAAMVADSSADTASRDEFGKLRIVERRYTSADIDVPTWQPHIETDYQQWLPGVK